MSMSKSTLRNFAAAAVIATGCSSGPTSPELEPLGDGIELSIDTADQEPASMIPIDDLLERIEYPELVELGVSGSMEIQTKTATYNIFSFGESTIIDALYLQSRIEYLEQIANAKSVENLTILDANNNTDEIAFLVQPSELTRRYVFFIPEDTKYPSIIFPDTPVDKTPRGLTIGFGNNNTSVSIIRGNDEDALFTELCQATQAVTPTSAITAAEASIAQETVCNSWRRAFHASRAGQTFEEYLNSIEVDYANLPPNPTQRNGLPHPIEESLYLAIP